MNILLAGAGQSSSALINYLLKKVKQKSWVLTVMDNSYSAIVDKTKHHPNSRPAAVDINNQEERQRLVKENDIVLSLMPPDLHYLLAKDCLQFGKHLITASYISEQIKELDKEATDKGLMFMCEMGLDPGIDHMTAMEIFKGIRKVTGTITRYHSFCGGLVAPENDDNPWHYKFSWNPANVISAGSNGAQYLINGQTIRKNQKQLFNEFKTLSLGNETWAYYPNRDSLKYLDLYGLEETTDIMRATLRHPQFMNGWDLIIKLGLNSEQITADTTGWSYANWVNHSIGIDDHAENTAEIVSKKLHLDPQGEHIDMLKWLGLFDQTSIPLEGVQTNAQILLSLLLKKWEMKPDEKDMVIMHHEVDYHHRGKKYQMASTLKIIGEDKENSAMAKTVGLPMGILAVLILEGKIKPIPGVQIPVSPEIYTPVLKLLKKEGIVFEEKN